MKLSQMFTKSLTIFYNICNPFKSSSIQTNEPMKSHTILEMGSHDLSPHTFECGIQLWKGPQKRFLKNSS